MIKRFIRVTCDRCGFHADVDQEESLDGTGWSNFGLDGFIRDPVTLCPVCTDAKKMVDEAFMRDTPFGLRCDSNTRPKVWYISN